MPINIKSDLIEAILSDASTHWGPFDVAFPFTMQTSDALTFSFNLKATRHVTFTCQNDVAEAIKNGTLVAR